MPYDLKEFEKTMPREQIDAVWRHYNLPRATHIETGGGTASPKVILTTPEGRVLLKRRRREFSHPEWVAYDHSLLRHLAAEGFPVACPIVTRQGESAVYLDGWSFEIMPYIEGLEPCRQGHGPQRRAAARLLARFHTRLAGFTPEGRKERQREFHAGANAGTLREAINNWSVAGVKDPALETARRMLRLLESTASYLADDRVAGLPHTISHGDYTAANVFFRGDAVGGLFDFDWAMRGCRLDDLARAVITFAARRQRPIDDHSIWSLTQAYETDRDQARELISVYAAGAKMTAAERRALPWFVREVTLSMRVRAMRKVPDAEKLAILTIDMAGLLPWLEEGAGDLAFIPRDGGAAAGSPKV